MCDFATDIAEDIEKYPRYYWDGNADSWHENLRIRAYRATNVTDLESLLIFRRDYYEHRHYLIFFAFEANPLIDDIIGIEILVQPPVDNLFSSDDDDFLEVEIDDGGHSPPIEE